MLRTLTAVGGTGSRPFLKAHMDDTGIIRVVAGNVRRARSRLSISQEELADAAEVDRTYISQVERAKRNITVVVLARLARALNLSPEALLNAASAGEGQDGSARRRKK